MEVINIAICDDDISDALQEKEQIEKISIKECEWNIDIYTSSEALFQSTVKYDIFFLDVEMEDMMNGIDIAERIHRKSKEPLIFFATNHEGYMDEAMNKHLFRFFVKPINQARLGFGLKSAIDEIYSNRKHIMITADTDEKKIIRIKEIVCVYHSGRQTHIITTEEEIDTYDPLKSVISKIGGSEFFATHGSCYVNMNYVSYYNKTEVICSYGEKEHKAFFSRRKYAEFNERFKEWSCGLK